LHAAWLALRGLTSVAFLLVAGFAFQLATLRDLERHRSDRGAVARRYRRAGMLVLLGYALHFDFFGAVSGSGLRAALDGALIVDVLQCIGVSLALLETLALLLPTRRAVELACCALGALLLALSPWFAALDPRGPLLPLLQYLTPRGGSLFPLLPWAAHVLLGAGLGSLLLGARSADARGVRLLLTAAALLGLSILVDQLGVHLPADHLRRAGCVLGAAALLTRLERRAANWPAWTRRLAGETLFLYAFHVLLVYGQGVGLGALIGARLAPLPAALLAAAVIGLSTGLALSYQRTLAGLARSAATG
jgi:uncharacterized membrane protein